MQTVATQANILIFLEMFHSINFYQPKWVFVSLWRRKPPNCTKAKSQTKHKFTLKNFLELSNDSMCIVNITTNQSLLLNEQKILG